MAQTRFALPFDKIETNDFFHRSKPYYLIVV